MGKLEGLILAESRRGIDRISDLLPPDYCVQAGEFVLSWPRGRVLLITGFYVNGRGETDGPPGTKLVYDALLRLGFSPLVVTDPLCADYFTAAQVPFVAFDTKAGEGDLQALLERERPVGLISIERCGRDLNGIYANMRHVDISAGTAPCDALFLKALGTIPTIGVGDGGNEIGMGNVAEAVRTRLNLVPAEVKADILVIATVSNWGAYGIVAALEQLTRLPLLLSFSKAERFLRRTVGMGSVDGISHEHIVRVDGFGMEIEKEILDGLHEYNSVRLHALAS